MTTTLRGALVRLLASAILFIGGARFSRAQVVQNSPAPGVTAAQAAAQPVIELSPFEVRAENDAGYQAGNTTSGSRLNSRLKDTPASVSPFTAEFLSDIAATNLQ